MYMQVQSLPPTSTISPGLSSPEVCSTILLSSSNVPESSRVLPASKVQNAIKEEKWAKAMEVEMDALKKNGTWDLVPLPHGKKIVGCRWVYTVKRNADGSVMQGWLQKDTLKNIGWIMMRRSQLWQRLISFESSCL
ncbi:hypothetical protein ACLB2K_025900 [Fragaria x ananassa]